MATDHIQILKCHDDHLPVKFTVLENAEDKIAFKLADDNECSWAATTETFGVKKLRSRIEPWLTALMQSEHLSVLIGSGLSHAIHNLAAKTALPGMAIVKFDDSVNELIATEAKRAAEVAGRKNGNFEDQIRVANELLRGLEILGDEKAENAKKLRTDIKTAISNFAKAILEGERNLITAPDDDRELAFSYLVSFLMSFASRAAPRERLQLFTTNYDRYIEAGADAAGLRLMDRFVGTLAPVFRASRLDVDLHYNPPGIRGEPRYLEGVAHFTKLHGSVDWIECGRTIHRIGLPFGIDDPQPYLVAPGLVGADAMRLMIYPNAAKDRETASYPYVELFRDFAAAICQPNSTLFCNGYSFGDEHINRVIEDMLTIPSAHLVVIARSDSLGRIMSTYERLGRKAQITLLLGDHLGDIKVLVDHFLPKPAIDRTTFRMAELLKARWNTSKSTGSAVMDPVSDDGTSP